MVSSPPPVLITIPGLPLDPEDENNRKLYDRIIKKTARAVTLLDKVQSVITTLNSLHIKYAEREGTLG